MPNKGNVIGVKELENLEAQTYNENIEEKRNIELMFTRERPKTPLYSKFARPSTGKHSIYQKQKMACLKRQFEGCDAQDCHEEHEEPSQNDSCSLEGFIKPKHGRTQSTVVGGDKSTNFTL
jgi:hypothetical protein